MKKSNTLPPYDLITPKSIYWTKKLETKIGTNLGQKIRAVAQKEENINT